MDDFYGRQSEGPSDAELLAYYDPTDEVISPVRPVKPVAGTKSPAPSSGAAAQPQMRYAPETETPGRRRGPGGAAAARPSESLESTLRPGEARQPPWLDSAEAHVSHRGHAEDEGPLAANDGYSHQNVRQSSSTVPAPARASAQYVNPEDLPAGLHQRQQFTSANVTQTSHEVPPARRQPVTSRSHTDPAATTDNVPVGRKSPVTGASRSASQRSAEDVGGSGYGSLLAPAPVHHRHHPEHGPTHQRQVGQSQPVSARASHDSAPWNQAPAAHEERHQNQIYDDHDETMSAQEEVASVRLLQELERERQRTAALEAKLEEAAARADAASAAAIDMQAQLRHASRAVGGVRSPSKDSPEKVSAVSEASAKEVAETAAEIARLKAQVSDLEAALERERDEHRQNVKRLVESTSDDVAKAISRAREAEAATEQLRARVGAQQTEVEVAQARAATLSRALEEERQDNAALSASFRTRLAAAVSAPVYSAPQATSMAPRDPAPPAQFQSTSQGQAAASSAAPSYAPYTSQQQQQQHPQAQFQASQPTRSPPRHSAPADYSQAAPAQQQQQQQQHRDPESMVVPPPQPRAMHTPERVSREAPALLRTPPRQTPRVPTTAVPAAGVQSPQQHSAEGPDGTNLSPTRAGQNVRDKNATLPSAVDPREVEALEGRLFELSKDRDATDQQLRRIENVRIRSLADKAKKDNLTRRLAELNNAVSDVRKRLRELSALER